MVRRGMVGDGNGPLQLALLDVMNTGGRAIFLVYAGGGTPRQVSQAVKHKGIAQLVTRLPMDLFW